VARLRLLCAAVSAGHPIGDVARLSDAELERRLERVAASPTVPPLEPILGAIGELDAEEAERLLGAQLSVLGGARFVRLLASPLLVEIGRRWEHGSLGVASEHLGSAILRNLLGSCLRRTRAAALVPPILFTTPPGERHELGTLMAAVRAIDAGGHPVFLGPDLPVPELVAAAGSLGAAAVALGVCRSNGADPSASIRAVRTALPGSIDVWVGGPGAGGLDLPAGVAIVSDADDLERKVALLAERGTPG
jgi:hypothetical protein